MESSYFIHKTRSKKVWTIIGWVVLGIVGITGFAFLFGYVVMMLWNWLMPLIFGLKEIEFWQAVGIIILAKLLFGGFSGHHKCGDTKRKKTSDCNDKQKTKAGFSKWKHYNKFWESEGESAFNNYIEKIEHESNISSETDKPKD